MNKQRFYTTQRFSVNSSLSTLQNGEYPLHQNTSFKSTLNKRFSNKEVYHGTAQKENLRNNFVQSHIYDCLNHSNKQAQYIALEHSSEPMHLCERCAILVASKGFQVKKISQKRLTNTQITQNDLKKKISLSLSAIKQQRKMTLSKLQVLEGQLQKQQCVVEEYFSCLQRYLQSQKQSFCKQIMSSKRQIQNMKNQANKYFINLLQKVRDISEEKFYATRDFSAQLIYYLDELAQASFKIDVQKAQVNYKLVPLQQMANQLHSLLDYKENKQARNLEIKIERSSPNRSLQLSFEVEMNAESKENVRKNGNQKALIQNLLTSIQTF